MIRDLRFAIGSCSFKQPSAWRGIGYQYLCDIVEAKLEQLKKLDRAKLIGLPKAQEENAWLDGSWIQIVIDHEKREFALTQSDLVNPRVQFLVCQPTDLRWLCVHHTTLPHFARPSELLCL